MKRILTSILALIVFLSWIGIRPNISKAAEIYTLDPYTSALEAFNQKNNTNYAFLDNTSMANEIIDYYTKMTIDEFTSYLNDIYSKDKAMETEQNANIIITDNGISTYDFTQTQHYYYSGSNSLYARTHVKQSSSSSPEYDYVDGYGAHHPDYPYYDPSLGFSSSISNDRKKLSCVFDCKKYVDKYLIDTGKYTISVTFIVNAGNIYPLV